MLALLLLGRTVQRIPPLWNWDVLGYMALALEWTEDDPVEVHRATYDAARSDLEPAVFRELTDQRVEVRRARFQDAEAFTEHIAFYRARVLFTLLTRLLHGAGAPLPYAVWWLSLAAFAGTALLICRWLAGRTSLWSAVLGGLLLAHAPPLLVTARFATADGLGTLLACLGAYFLLERRRARVGAALLTISILTRPDAVILIGILAVALLWFERGAADRLGLRFHGLWLLASALAYLGVQSFAGEYGWWPLFQISFAGKAVHPAALPTEVDWTLYRAVLDAKLAEIPGGGYWSTPRLVSGSTFAFVYLGFGVIALGLLGRRLRDPRFGRHLALLAALGATYFLRWFLFPQLWDRFLAPVYVLVPLVIVSLVALARERDDADADQNASKAVTPAMTSS